MLVQYIREVLGTPPVIGNTSYEVLEYMVSAAVLIWGLALGYRFILSIFGNKK